MHLFASTLQAETASTPPTFEVTRQNLYATLERSCVVEYGDPVQVVAPLDGMVEGLMSDGAEVRSGEILARYDLTETERDLELARAQLASLIARIETLTGPLADARQELHDLEMAAAERRFADAQAALDTAQELSEQGRLSETRLAETEELVRTTASDLTRLRVQYTIADLEQQLQIRGLRDNEFSQRIGIDRLEERIAQGDIAAPMDGRISYVTPQLAASGRSVVRAGAHLFSVAPQDRRWLNVGLTAAEAERLRNAEVAVQSLDGTRHPATLERISLLPDTQAFQKHKFEALIVVDTGSSDLFVGQDVICVFRHQIAEDVLAVPISRLQNVAGADGVILVGADGDTTRAITTGRVAPPMIEVTTGLSEGDIIR